MNKNDNLMLKSIEIRLREEHKKEHFNKKNSKFLLPIMVN
jgi:hypothetical protein